MPTVVADLDLVQQILPHRPPFLFVDRVTRLKPGASIVAERDLRPEEPHFAGHFPGRPMMPGVLLVDALAQVAGLLVGLTLMEAARTAPSDEAPPAGPRIFFLSAANVRFPASAVPGDTLRLSAWAGTRSDRLAHFDVRAEVGRRVVAEGDLTLALVDGRG